MPTPPSFQPPAFLNDLAEKVSAFARHSPAADIEQNLRAGLSTVFSKLDLVTREEFDIQAELLARTKAKLDALEARVAALEALIPSTQA